MSVGDLLAFVASLFLSFLSGLDQVYLVSVLEVTCTLRGVPHMLIINWISSEIFASRNQLKNALKTNFLNVKCWGRTSFEHVSIVLTVKPRTYSFLQYDFTFYFILFYFQFYLSISFLFILSVTSDIMLYILIICESSIWQFRSEHSALNY